jgi:hypothetical protein
MQLLHDGTYMQVQDQGLMGHKRLGVGALLQLVLLVLKIRCAIALQSLKIPSHCQKV